jgi:hypothetical protein
MRDKCSRKEEAVLAAYIISCARIAFTNKDCTRLLTFPSAALLSLADLHSIYTDIFPWAWPSNARRDTVDQMSIDQTFPYEQNINGVHIQGSQQTFIGRFENVTVPGRREPEGIPHLVFFSSYRD